MRRSSSPSNNVNVMRGNLIDAIIEKKHNPSNK